MGQIINAHCPGCDAKGESLSIGRGMIDPWPWESRMYVCDPCNKLQMATMVVPLSQLRRVADGRVGAPADSRPALPTTNQQLAQLLLKAKAWPECSDCGKQLGGRWHRAEPTPKCPRCHLELNVTIVAFID